MTNLTDLLSAALAESTPATLPCKRVNWASHVDRVRVLSDLRSTEWLEQGYDDRRVVYVMTRSTDDRACQIGHVVAETEAQAAEWVEAGRLGR